MHQTLPIVVLSHREVAAESPVMDFSPVTTPRRSYQAEKTSSEAFSVFMGYF